MILIKKD